MLAFEDACSAAEWALTLQLALMELPWPRELLALEMAAEVADRSGRVLLRGLRVRIGIFQVGAAGVPFSVSVCVCAYRHHPARFGTGSVSVSVCVCASASSSWVWWRVCFCLCLVFASASSTWVWCWVCFCLCLRSAITQWKGRTAPLPLTRRGKVGQLRLPLMRRGTAAAGWPTAVGVRLLWNAILWYLRPVSSTWIL